MGGGILTGRWKKLEDIPKDSHLISSEYPRFSEENFPTNMQLFEKVKELARTKSCTPAQLAINWTRALSRRPGMPLIIPIPGATTEARVEENCKLVEITDNEMEQIDAILAKFKPAGERFPSHIPTDT